MKTKTTKYNTFLKLLIKEKYKDISFHIQWNISESDSNLNVVYKNRN